MVTDQIPAVVTEIAQGSLMTVPWQQKQHGPDGEGAHDPDNGHDPADDTCKRVVTSRRDAVKR
jgi:hypothetical protein